MDLGEGCPPRGASEGQRGAAGSGVWAAEVRVWVTEVRVWAAEVRVWAAPSPPRSPRAARLAGQWVLGALVPAAR